MICHKMKIYNMQELMQIVAKSKSNSYNENATVYALTCSPEGEFLTENT